MDLKTRLQLYIIQISYSNLQLAESKALVLLFRKQRQCKFMPSFLDLLHSEIVSCVTYVNPIALRKAKVVCNFGLSECRRVKLMLYKANLFTYSLLSLQNG